jgi:ribosome assembly protein YihI (activator of Der GTPase)
MSRTKKSRKPATAPKAQPKLSKAELANVEKRVRKKTGKKPGNRQQEAEQKKSSNKANSQARDPRIGSKTPIDLGGVAKKPQAKSAKSKSSEQQPIAAIRYAEPAQDTPKELNLDLHQELAAIEADEQLQVILAKQEDDIALTEQEVDYYNQLMERHQTITEQLGLDEESEEEEFQQNNHSEDDLWDKLDKASDNFTDFE